MECKGKILIINQNSGYLTIDVANAFSTIYEEVVVMYGLNKVTERNFNSKINHQKTVKLNRSSHLKRILSWLACTIHIFILLLWKYRNYTILYYTNPPIAYFNSLFFRNKFSIVVFDTYPDSLRLIGISEKLFVYKIWVSVNRKVFSKAVNIITLSDGMKSQLKHYVSENKIKVVQIWPASNSFKPIPKEQNIFLKLHKWEKKFVILYSGNMGIGHKLEILVDLAESLVNITDILFLLIGEGSKKKGLQTLATSKSLQNIAFLTWQDASIFPYSLASGNIAVVALESEATYTSVPSKTFNYMAVGAPLLGIGNSGSELERLITSSQLGMFVQDYEILKARKFILELFQNELIEKQFSNQVYNVSKKYSFSQASEYIF